MTVSPSNPEMEGNSEVYHDNRPDESHEKEVNKGGGQSDVAEEVKHQGSPESTKQEKDNEDEE